MAKIPLTKGMEAIADDADARELMKHRWYATKSGSRYYAARRTYTKGVRGIVYMHRQIIECPPDKQVDHLNGDGLDNRRMNLRSVSRSQNLLNSSLATRRGFCRCKQTGKWFARISFEGRRIMLGRFRSQEDAAAAVGLARFALRQGMTPANVPSHVAAQIQRSNLEDGELSG